MKIKEIIVKESATGGSTSAGNIASVSNPIAGAAGLQRRPSLFGYIDSTGPVKSKKKKRKKKKDGLSKTL